MAGRAPPGPSHSFADQLPPYAIGGADDSGDGGGGKARSRKRSRPGATASSASPEGEAMVQLLPFPEATASVDLQGSL